MEMQTTPSTPEMIGVLHRHHSFIFIQRVVIFIISIKAIIYDNFVNIVLFSVELMNTHYKATCSHARNDCNFQTYFAQTCYKQEPKFLAGSSLDFIKSQNWPCIVNHDIGKRGNHSLESEISLWAHQLRRLLCHQPLALIAIL